MLVEVEIDPDVLRPFLADAQDGGANHYTLMHNFYAALGRMVQFGMGYRRATVRVQRDGELLGIYYPVDDSSFPFVMGGVYRGPIKGRNGDIHNEGEAPEWTFHS